MSGDCGHGWGYHYDGADGPCYACMDEKKRRQEKYAVVRRIAERGLNKALNDYDEADEPVFSNYVDLFQHLLDEITRLENES